MGLLHDSVESSRVGRQVREYLVASCSLSRKRVGFNPKLRVMRCVNPQPSWGFTFSHGSCSDYVRSAGWGSDKLESVAMGWRWLGEHVHAGAGTGKRTWLRVRVARWSSRPLKLR